MCAALQEAMDRASQGRTAIVIAHRLGTIQDSDEIVVMELGKVLEQGSHDQLMAMGGKYASLQQQASLTE